MGKTRYELSTTPIGEILIARQDAGANVAVHGVTENFEAVAVRSGFTFWEYPTFWEGPTTPQPKLIVRIGEDTTDDEIESMLSKYPVFADF